MLNGKLSIERADNGWILSWYETRKSLTTTIDPCREVFADAFECLLRLSEVVGIVAGAAAARAVCELAESHAQSEDSGGPVNPATDPDVQAYAAPGCPDSVMAGD
jgi:hypothetical protein